MQPPAAPQPNTLGNAGLGLGIVSASLVFGLGLCALTAAQQGGWRRPGRCCSSAARAARFWGCWGRHERGRVVWGQPLRVTAVVGLA